MSRAGSTTFVIRIGSAWLCGKVGHTADGSVCDVSYDTGLYEPKGWRDREMIVEGSSV